MKKKGEGRKKDERSLIFKKEESLEESVQISLKSSGTGDWPLSSSQKTQLDGTESRLREPESLVLSFGANCKEKRVLLELVLVSDLLEQGRFL